MKVNWLVFPHGIMASRRHSWVFWFQLLDSSQQHTCLKSQETHSKYRAAIRVKELGTLDMEVTFSSSRELPRLSLGQESIPGSLPGPAKSSRWALISGIICSERKVQILTALQRRWRIWAAMYRNRPQSSYGPRGNALSTDLKKLQPSQIIQVTVGAEWQAHSLRLYLKGKQE